MIKNFLSTGKIEVLIGILATGMISVSLFSYAIQEPKRIAVAQEKQLAIDLDDGMSLYAENCSVCHGLAGEGIGSTPALDDPYLRSSDYDALYKIIERGLFGTSMPAWSLSDGGPLSEYQMGELVSLIRFGDWQETQERVVNMGLAPLVPFSTEPDLTVLGNLATEVGSEQLVRGITIYAHECVSCHGADGLGTALAPALNDPAIREQSPDTLERILLNGVPGTLMASWQNSLSDEDTEALITLLTQWGQVPSGTIPAPDRQVAVTEESLALGAELYSTNCARCHGPEGQGTPRAPSLNVKGFLTETNDVAIQQIITLGVSGTAMPAWGDRMTDADIQAIVGFMRAWEPSAPEVAEPARGGGSAWWSAESGTGSRGKGGGPPWMRNTNSGAPDGQSLPSGGASQSNSGNPEMDGVEAQQAGVSPNAPQGSRNFGSKTQASPGSGSSANSALEGQGREAPSGQTNEVVGDQTHSGQQDGPPWVSQNQQPVSWWQEMDWRIVIFVAGGFLVAFSLIILSVLKLRKLEFEI